MAQKEKARSPGSSGRSRTKSATGKSGKSTSGKSTSSKSKARKSRSSSGSTARSQHRGKPAGSGGRVGSAVETVEATAKGAGRTVGSAASKAKVPLMAGGAALAGAAGGLALGARRARRNGGLGSVLARRPQVKVRSRDLASAAKDVGSFGAQMGRLASELQSAREATNGQGNKHRSPLEVALEGLTARRTRS